MAVVIASLCCMILALLYVPGMQLSEDVLECDSRGGYWSSEAGTCQVSDSPAAGMAS